MAVLMPNILSLRDDMRRKGWHIAIYSFDFNGHAYFILFEDSKGIGIVDPLVIAVLTFIDKYDETRQLQAYANQQGFNVLDGMNLLDFLHVVPGGSYRDYYTDVLCPAFNIATPDSFTLPSDGHEKDIVTVRLSVRDKEPNPNAFYCYDVRPTGVRSDGTPKQRSIFNSNKTELRREKLYNKLKSEPRFSFFYTDDPAKERKDSEILELLAIRGYHIT